MLCDTTKKFFKNEVELFCFFKKKSPQGFILDSTYDNIQYLPFPVWLILLSTMPSISIHVIADSRTSFFLMAE